MYLRQLKDDSRGFAFSLDLLLALIPLTIILGMAAANMDSMFYLTEQTVFQQSLERVGSDTVNTLLETSGSPSDWEKYGNPAVPGLAYYDTRKNAPIENYVSPYKLAALNTSIMQDMLGPQYGYYINITNVNNTAQVYSLGTLNTSVSDIVRIERLVRISKYEIVSQGVGLRYTAQPRTYTSPPNPFQTNEEYNRIFDYYILVYNKGASSAYVEINGERIVRQNDFPADFVRKKIDPQYLMNQTPLMDNSVLIWVASTPGSTMDVYILQVPKGTPEDDVTLENAAPVAARFAFYIWIR